MKMESGKAYLMVKSVVVGWLIPVLILSGCKRDTEKAGPLFIRMTADETGVVFSNDIRQNDSLNILEYMYFYNGGGVGLGDINNDGLTDVFLSGNMVSSRLFLNRGDLKFADITEKANVATKGWCTGVAMVDLNNDGFLDVYVSRAGSKNPAERANLLFINNGDNTFTESAYAYGVADTGYTTQAAFFDYDKDGDLDLYLLTHDHAPKVVNNPLPVKINGEGRNTDKLFRNEGLGRNGHPVFTDVSREAGILIEGYGLGVAVNDVNGDGWPDIYVSNDFLSNDLLYINNRDGTFTNRMGEYLKHESYNGMGADISDYNNDGLQDIVVVDMLPEDNYRQKIMSGSMTNEKFDFILQMGYAPQYMRNTLQLNNGNGSFSEIGQLAGIDKTDWSWSPLLADLDNDGFKDLFVTNGYLKDITDKDFISFSSNKIMFKDVKDVNATLLALMDEQEGVELPNYAFKNNRDLTFTRALDWGFDEPAYSNGAAFGDLDNDGDLDLVINNINANASIYRNESQRLREHHYLTFALRGDSLNKLALGTKVVLRYQGKLQLHEHTLYRGYQSTVGNTVHFGLGDVNTVDTVDVYWPDGKVQRIFDVKANQHLTLHQKDAHNIIPQRVTPPQPLFVEVSADLGIDYRHTENRYSDLSGQPLLPHTYSSIGPSIAAGDIDGNGFDDFYIGGTAGNPATIFLQERSGKFLKREFVNDLKYEDAGTLLFDADNDGDLDLYVVSGGSEFPAGSRLYQDRLYINDGKGNFHRDSLAIPVINASGGCVTAADFDRDGDLDLFVGGRVLPGRYPEAPDSYILRNEGGKFTDVTAEVGPGIRNVGMVTAALWTDYDNDGSVDLIIVGEWMPVTFFRNVDGQLVDVTSPSGLGNSSGWWNSLAGADMDNDGDVDYLLGNLGLNTPFKATEDEPLTVYSGNHDGSGVRHPILSWYIQGKAYPWASRDVLLRQMPRFGKRFLKYNDYAKATMEDIVSMDNPEKALVLKSSHFSSSYMENLGDGKFSLKALPMKAQFAPINGILIRDFDNDGNLDVLATGNSYAPDVSIGRYDASTGLYLKGDGEGNFSVVNLTASGFVVDSDARSLVQLYSASGEPLILAGANADRLSVYTHRGSPKTRRFKLNTLDAFCTLKTTGRKVEFYYASGYLSQSSRVLEIAKEIESFVIVDSQGIERKNGTISAH